MLKQYEKQHGKKPEALENKPDLPWYYHDIFNYYMLLSNKRDRLVINTYTVIKNQVVPQSKLVPKPIDINSILLLAQSTAIMNPKDFLTLVSDMDTMYLKKQAEKND